MDDVKLDDDLGTMTGLQGQIGCEWADYESAAIDHGRGPEWVVSTKQDDGLVEVLS